MGRHRDTFTTREQQVVEALYLSLLAPEEHIRQACLLLADQFSVGLDERTVALCEAAARERFEGEDAA